MFLEEGVVTSLRVAGFFNFVTKKTSFFSSKLLYHYNLSSSPLNILVLLNLSMIYNLMLSLPFHLLIGPLFVFFPGQGQFINKITLYFNQKYFANKCTGYTKEKTLMQSSEIQSHAVRVY